MSYQFGSQPSPQGSRKRVIIVSTDVANLQCIGKEKGAGGSTYIIDLTTSIGLFSHNPSIGEEWVITQIQGLWSLERKTSLQNVAIPAMQSSQVGDTVFNAPGKLIIASTPLDITNGDVSIDNGNLNMTNGSISTGSGNISTASGNISTANGGISITNGNLNLTRGSLSAFWNTNTTDSYITDNSLDIDVWSTKTTGPIASTVNGGTNWTFVVDYRISFDRSCDVRFTISAATATTTAGNATFSSGSLQVAFPLSIRPSVSPSGLAVKGAYNANTGTGQSSAISAPSGIQIVFYQLPAGTNAIVGSLLYLIDKPIF